ncbi:MULTISPECIES: beta-lactamase hydrolase domain-containing protein [unclassified Coleofasciculus]|uniref:beta-lactamase hydrolase domain-containing protein n=1 Tax=unclassified Coleofasciculus TaxID=2692782 RepID=UPI0018816A99|nr:MULTISPECIES: protein tyrosine phosphatase family protein [unclassified Coleofasciculus]MBE9128243.1 protein tyrosine phosphatase family protein [Coleofasciculus sp. LEGE 07081]MBE9148565.1 protein tyrosine phosphatase family protein [Coleofasciculus sp. LEGE 07092]
MQNAQKINEQLIVATNQVTSEQLQQAGQEGIKSVLNLRSPDEEGFSSDEQQQAESTGLEYTNIPVKPDAMSDELADKVLQEIDRLPKPTLLHCKSGMRSGAMALMYVATQEGMTAEEAMEKGKQLGFDCDKSPQMKEFFKHYISSHSKAS